MADFGVPTAGQLEKINALAKRTLSKDEVFAFPTKMVGDALLTERYMKLHKSLLELIRLMPRLVWPLCSTMRGQEFRRL